MAKLLINPLSLQSIGGYAVTITAIDPDALDCLVGYVSTPENETYPASWNPDGYIRGGADDCNHGMPDDDLVRLVDWAKICMTKSDQSLFRPASGRPVAA